MRVFAALRLLAILAVRNQVANGVKTAIVGGIVFFGALVVVLGHSLLDSVDAAMSQSIIGSIAGHVQVYSAKSRDELTVMGGTDLDGADITPVDDFARLQATLLAVPNVKAVVPMGISGALVTSGNVIDLVLANLRQLVRQREAGGRPGAYEAEKAHVRQIVRVLEANLANKAPLESEGTLESDNTAAVRRAASDAFWATFDANPTDALELLENRVAPQAADGDMVYLRYVGTDPAAFARSFQRMHIVDGATIPPGQRGFLFSKQVYESTIKLKTARRLDRIKSALDSGRRLSDPKLKRMQSENISQVNEIQLQLDEKKAELFRRKLQAHLHLAEADLGRLLAAFLDMTDANFKERYRFFYAELAPSLELYRVRVGDTLTIRAFTRTGHVQSVNVKVYGTFEFEGLERSPQAGGLNLMDMVTFRELYGFLTEDAKRELEGLKATLGTRDVPREGAEAALFGAPRPTEPRPRSRNIVATATPGLTPDQALSGLRGTLQRKDLVARAYDPAQLQGGAVLSAAVILHDGRRLDETMGALTAAGAAAGIPLKAISWQKASGLVGQFVSTMRIILAAVVLITFIIGLIVINNSLLLATLQRVPEIGTLRALGARRRFVVGMLMAEALAVGCLFGGAGAALGSLIVWRLGRVGVPAVNDVMRFFFSGPRLHPILETGSIAGAVAIVVTVSVLSSVAPALLALKVSPRRAMQTEE